MSCSSALPFPRGKTASDYAALGSDAILTEGGFLGLCGRQYKVKDSVHGTEQEVTLRAVKNLGSDITVARLGVAFSVASALDFGRKINGAPAAGGVGLPIDDAYTVGSTIKQYDVFYVVEKGPCSVNTEASSVNLAAGAQVAFDDTGAVNGAAAAAGEFVLGTIDAASTTAAEAVVVHVDCNLAKPDAAG